MHINGDDDLNRDQIKAEKYSINYGKNTLLFFSTTSELAHLNKIYFMPIKLNESMGSFAPVVKTKIIAMIKEFRNHQRGICTQHLRSRFGSSRPNIEDSNYALVTIKELQDFFADNPEANTVRIYFAAHDTPTQGEIGMELQGQMTTILVPALATFDSQGRFAQVDDLLNENPEQGAVNSVSMNFVFNGMGDDQYPLCPPNCPPGRTL